MNQTVESPTATTDELRQLLDSYAQAHGVDVWFWQRLEDGWSVTASTGTPRSVEPRPDAIRIDFPHGPESRIEISSGEEGACRFLATQLGRLLRHQAESRFFGRELAERYEEITLLYTISEILGSVISLEEAATTILAEVVDTLAVRRAALWVHDEEAGILDLIAAVGGPGQPGPIVVDDETSITATVFRNRRPMILEPGEVFPRDERSTGGSNRESFLSVPVSYTPPRGESRTIGVINLVGRTAEEPFSAGDQKLITAIASQIGAAVENNRLVADSLQQERMVREMELAHDLQLKLLPSTEQFRDHAEVAARCAPADSVGGDFYHLFRLPGGRLGVMIGDVSSHGFAAALIMALTMSAVAIHASEGDQPAEVLRRLHRALIDELETTEMYLTLFYGVIDPVNGTLTFANAGHSPAFLIPGEGPPRRLRATNPPFGIVDLDNYGEETVPWTPKKDTLLLFTDGLSDAISASNGEETIVRLVHGRRGDSVDRLLSALFTLEQADGDVPSDDRSAVLVRV
ncbi:MAG: GAF domain-containing SpoIIE family protein phosphatase [Gemmatimonadota bacterium]